MKLLGSFCLLIAVSIPVVLLLIPSVTVHLCMLIDFYTPWILFESKFYDHYHNFLISTLSEKKELPLPELLPNEVTKERILQISNHYTFPFVIRGALKDAEGVQKWSNSSWWLDNYSDEEVLCGTLSEVVENCTIKTFFDGINNKKPFYISGASTIFHKNPELHQMVDNEYVRGIEPQGYRSATQIFMGVPTMGSDIHCAMGVNV